MYIGRYVHFNDKVKTQKFHPESQDAREVILKILNFLIETI